MSGTEPGLMPSRGGEPYGMSLQIPSAGGGGAAMSNMCLDFNTDPIAAYKPVMPNSPSYHQHDMVPFAGGDSVSVDAPPPPVDAQPSIDINYATTSAEPLKRKRGRPRKYPLDDSAGTPQPQQSMSSTGNGFSGALEAASGKRGRGRPPGSGRKQIAAATALGYGFLGPAGVGFTPHIITVKVGEDITSQILSFIQNGGQAVCILSAVGAVSNVTLCQSATSGGSITYKGRFDIISLSGSFMLSESGGQRIRTGGLSVSFAGPDGQVLGGCVTGPLNAAAPIQMVVGSFSTGGQKQKSNSENQVEPLFAPKLVGGNDLTQNEVTDGEIVNNSNMAAWK